MGGSDVLATAFTRDLLGRIVEKVETTQGQTSTFGYEYDLNGNRISKTDHDGSVTAGTYDDQDRLLNYGDITYTSNANGDLTSKTQHGATVTYDYDVFGNLRHVSLDNGIEIDYVIDGRNRRIGKKINGTLVQGFLYDDQLRIAAELDGANQVVSRFVYGTHVNVPELIVKGSTTYRIIHDHLGSPRLIVNTSDGSIAQRLDFDEFGIVTLDTNPSFQPFGFAGGLYDTQTRLVRFGARDYDPQVGRWTSKDPVGFVGGWDLFVYSGNDPVNVADRLGWACESGDGGDTGFGSGPWGRRPSPCSCNKGLIDAAAASDARQLARMDHGDVPKGSVTGSNFSNIDCDRNGWCTPTVPQWAPFTPYFDPNIQDPCVQFCTRMHEWVHYTDTRPFNLHWPDNELVIFLERPAYQKSLDCLRSF